MFALENRSIAGKFKVLIGLIALGVISAVGIGVYATASLSSELMAGSDQSIQEVTRWKDLTEAMLMARRSEKDFLLRSVRDLDFYSTGRSKYLQKHADAVATMRATIKEIRATNAGADFDKLKGAVTIYEQSFRDIVAKHRGRGIGDFGVVGELRNAIHALEAKVENKPQLLAKMLFCRRHEKDYLLRRDAKSFGKLSKAIGTLRAAVKAGGSNFDTELDACQKGINQLRAADIEIGLSESSGIRGRMRSAVNSLENPIAAGVKAVLMAQEKQRTALEERRRQMIGLLLVIGAVLLGVVIWFCVRFSKDMIHQVDALRGKTGRVAAGDLTVTFRADEHSEDELRCLEADFAELVASLRDHTQVSQQLSQELGSASVQINAAVQEQAAALSNQAAAITQASGALEELNASANTNDRRAQGVLGVTKETIDGMSQVKGEVGAIASSIVDLSERIQQIGDILNTVSDIADQSNLLALNASIEAAKAGEFGRGFEVVATEVRSLAQQSQNATLSIRTMLRDIQRSMSTAVMKTEEGTKSVAKQSIELSDASRSVEQIVYAMREQTVAIVQIVESVSSVSTGIRETQAGSDQIAEATSRLASQAGNLKATLERNRYEA